MRLLTALLQAVADQPVLQIGTSFVENVRASGQLGQLNKFSLYLPRDGNRAELTLGCISSATDGRFASKIQVMYPAQLGRVRLLSSRFAAA